MELTTRSMLYISAGQGHIVSPHDTFFTRCARGEWLKRRLAVADMRIVEKHANQCRAVWTTHCHIVRDIPLLDPSRTFSSVVMKQPCDVGDDIGANRHP